MSELDTILSGGDDVAPTPETQEPTPAPAPEAEVTAEATPDTPPADTPAEPEATPAEDKTEQMVPLSALLAVRGDLADLKAQVARAPAPQPEQPQAAPDPIQDPEGFQAYFQKQIANERLNTSEAIARASHGNEAVDAAFTAAQQAGVVGNFVNHPNAWGEIVNWHKGQQEIQAIREAGGLEAVREAAKAEALREFQAAQVAKQTRPAAPPSLASETSIGGRDAPAYQAPGLSSIIGEGG